MSEDPQAGDAPAEDVSTEPTALPTAGEVPTVHEAIGRVIRDMGQVGKGQTNPQQGYSYRGIDDVMAALKPALGAHGVFIVPEVVARETSERTTQRGTINFVVDLAVKYRIYGPRGDHIEAGPLWGEGTDSLDKAPQKALTGAFKYLLFELFCVAGSAEADPDAHGGGHHDETRAPLPGWYGWEDQATAEKAHEELGERIKAAGDAVIERCRQYRREHAPEGMEALPWPMSHPSFEEFAAFALELIQQEASGDGNGPPQPDEGPPDGPEHAASAPDHQAQPDGDTGQQTATEPPEPEPDKVQAIIDDVQTMKASAVDDELRRRNMPTDGIASTRRQRLALALIGEVVSQPPA